MKLVVLILVSFLTFSCAHGNKSKPESNVTITKNLKGHKYGNLYFSGQPSGKAIKELKAEGFSAVINLREKTEGKYQEFWEEGAVKHEELAYYNIPLSVKEQLTPAFIDSITKKVTEHRREGKVLVHCSSGNRVALWLGAHFKKDHEYSNEDSLQVAKKLGLTNKVVERKLSHYLEKH